MMIAGNTLNLVERPPYCTEAEELVYLRRENNNLKSNVEYLNQLLRLLKRQKFGPASEIYSKGQGTLFNESEFVATEDLEQDGEDSSTSVDGSEIFADPIDPPKPPKKRGKPVRKPLPADLARTEKIIDLAPDEKFCPISGLPLVRMGEEINEQLDIEPAKLKVLKTIRPKYVCTGPCCTEQVSQAAVIKIAPVETQAIPKSMATASLLAYIATAKYSDALPLYRLEQIFARYGIDLSRTTAARWMIACGNLITPLINLAKDELLAGHLVYADETRVQVLKRSGKKATSQSYMWVFMRSGPMGPKVILYELGPSRSHEVPLSYLDGYAGYLHTDGYAAYDTLADKMPAITLVGDWVHVRRKFDEAVKAQANPKNKLKASEAMTHINNLFRIEREMGEVTDERRLQIRQEKSLPIVNALKAWADETSATLPPKSLTGTAVNYMLGQWPKLGHFLNDPRLRLDTNLVENAIRPFVIGRKNWLFSDSMAGAQASAALYSLICMAKAQDLNPFEYLKSVFTELPKAQTLTETERLLPWNWRKPSDLN